MKILKRKPEQPFENDNSKKLKIEEEPEASSSTQINESDCYTEFDVDDLIVYSPEGSYSDENDQGFLEESDPLENFLQNENCFKTSPELPQCRECFQDKDLDKYSCRFYDFRKIEKNSDGTFRVAGFLDPHLDPTLEGNVILFKIRRLLFIIIL